MRPQAKVLLSHTPNTLTSPLNSNDHREEEHSILHTPSRMAKNRESVGDDYTGTGDNKGTGAFKELKHTSLSPRIHEIES